MTQERLARVQATIREVPTDGTVIQRCHEDAPEHQAMESLPVDSEDKPLLIEFDERLTRHKKDRYHTTLLQKTLAFCRYRNPPTPNGYDDSAHSISLEALLEEPSAAERFVDWITQHKTEDGDRIAPKTESHYRNMVRQYGDLMGDNGRPSHIENISSLSPRQKDTDPTPKRSNIHYWDESVVPILDSGKVHLRDKALIAVAWDSGARPSEIFRMKAGHLSDRGDYFLFEVEDSKTYDRTPHLQVSMPYLRKWLLEVDKMTNDVKLPTSPLSLPPDQPVWTKQKDSEKLKESTFEQRGSRIGNRLGYRRPTNLKQFRKSRASILAAKGVNQSTLRTRFGWEAGSSAPAHYIARFSDEANQQIADIDGAPIQIAEDYVEPSPIKCSSCEQWSPQHLEACFWCGSNLTGDEQTGDSEVERLRNKAEMNHAAKSNLRERISDYDVSASSMETALDIVEAMDSNPELTKESVAFTLMTEYDGINIDRVMELLGEGEDDLRTIFKGS
ncbi:tyrosine-type recombinase/integrase [Halobaculum sp. CBA1158]|uniref:site-specific integrase n=1 Tax=Halobaculum sp. CBA1158 TaxID=2904243 RepID=UPI001F200F61|nr:site-specific integrase [Halobaculum sp. CBA1158]UIO99872.1 tyrosine-type recombinase/integrase [Halobaculum sp. CBA1158]